MQVLCLWLPSSSTLFLIAESIHPFGCINTSQIYFSLCCICMLSGSYLPLFDISPWVGCHPKARIKLCISRTEFARLPLKPSLLPSPPALSVTRLSLSSLGDDFFAFLTSILPDQPKCHCNTFLLPHLWVSSLGPESISNSKSLLSRPYIKFPLLELPINTLHYPFPPSSDISQCDYLFNV